MTSVPELLGRAKARAAEVRARHPHVDRLVRTQEHYGRVGASQQAGAVTYFGFLSVFPLLAVAFFVVGWIAKVYPSAQTDLKNAIDDVLPGLVGSGAGQVQLATIQSAADTVGIIGILGLVYSGTSWVSALRSALVDVFEVPRDKQPNWFVANGRDLLTLVALGLILGVSVAAAGLVAIGPFGSVLSVIVGLATSVVLFWVMYVLLARPQVPHRALWVASGIAGVGFEILKQLSRWLLAHTQGTPAFQVFGVSLILLVWINYFTRVTLYAAAWAQVGPRADAAADAGTLAP